MNLLINSPSGKQELITIGAGGGYFDAARVIWDTRIDGAMPVITLGGMVRSANTLVFNQARADQHAAATQQEALAATKAAQDAADAASAKADAKLLALSGMSPSQVRAHFAANVNTFAELKDVVTTGFVLLSILARRL